MVGPYQGMVGYFFNTGMTKWQKNFGFLQFLFSKSHQFLWGWSAIRVWSDIFFRIFSTMVVYTGTVLYSERESTLCGVVYLSFDFVLKSNVSIVAVFQCTQRYIKWIVQYAFEAATVWTMYYDFPSFAKGFFMYELLQSFVNTL